MKKTNSFPIPFKSLRTIAGGKDGAYVIGAMFTAAYAEKADRLAASCEKLGLPYVLHEVPTVHRSMSRRGTDNLSYTKPNFIRHLLAAHKKSVLYLDADCECVSPPELIDRLVRSGCDFAIYNGYAEEYTDRFVPVRLTLGAEKPDVTDRFYRFAGSTRWHSKRQLGCSGCVQLYGNSVAARALLSRWQRTIEDFPGSADDNCLDFVFNNLSTRSWLRYMLKVQWLPKSYARISWWIHTKPTINHPDLPDPGSSFVPIKDPKGRKEAYYSKMEWRDPPAPFPRDGIIDTEKQMLCRLVDGQLIPIRPMDQKFWL